MKFFLAFFALFLVVAPALGELKGVAILFRHGERTQVFTMPKYGVSESYTDLGEGQLTLVSLD